MRPRIITISGALLIATSFLVLLIPGIFRWVDGTGVGFGSFSLALVVGVCLASYQPMKKWARQIGWGSVVVALVSAAIAKAGAILVLKNDLAEAPGMVALGLGLAIIGFTSFCNVLYQSRRS